MADYFLTANETRCFQNLLLLLFLAPQVSKSINDDAKDEVEDNDDDHEEEKQVVDHPGSEKGLLVKPNRYKAGYWFKSTLPSIYLYLCRSCTVSYPYMYVNLID